VLLLAFAQLAGAPRAWKVIHVTVDRLLLQDGSHRALISADPPCDRTICQVHKFFQVDDLPTLMLGELTFTSSGHGDNARRRETVPS